MESTPVMKSTERNIKKIFAVILIFLVLQARAELISGEIFWSGQYIPNSQLGELPLSETGSGIFTFDTEIQTGDLSGFFAENPPKTLFDGTYTFTTKDYCLTRSDLINFSSNEWIIYEEKKIPESTSLEWSLSGKLYSTNQFYFFHTDEIFHTASFYSGSFSIIPEPSTFSLLLIAIPLLLRNKQRRNRVK